MLGQEDSGGSKNRGLRSHEVSFNKEFNDHGLKLHRQPKDTKRMSVFHFPGMTSEEWKDDKPNPPHKFPFGYGNPTNAKIGDSRLYRQDMQNIPMIGYEHYGPRYAGERNKSQIQADGNQMTTHDGPHARGFRAQPRPHPTYVPRLQHTNGQHCNTSGGGAEYSFGKRMGRKIHTLDPRNGLPVANFGDLPYKHSHEMKDYYKGIVDDPALLRFIKSVPKRPSTAPLPAEIRELGLRRLEAIKKREEVTTVEALNAWAPPGQSADSDNEDDGKEKGEGEEPEAEA